MDKYIDVDKMIAEIKRLDKENKELLKSGGSIIGREFLFGMGAGYADVIKIIDSLQQEQPEVHNGKFVFPKYLYARTKDNKTIDMSYAPQDMTAVEYIRNDFVEHEQPEVDLENYISNKLRELGADLINHKPYSFNRGLNVGKTNAYNDILDRLNARKEE